ncbi:conserved hypothetical protein [Sphingomonas sp. EC-HK361]|uniref:endonuclease domain-containing protein n=1 Tax=Sphingomonas sp. EC-HK361 TaxID=2038397 RepID=UPI001258EF7E|nr:DUF559 domain-containing protein [Sphingomonas sp. EC-HK361]VVT23033.1 conserved hypothetical protein [Sphingomonas sp. EC-HK361]
MQLYQDQPGGTVQRARELRREAPELECRLLRALREAFPALKWRHQVPVGRYYADILCFSERLVIEVDGDTHGERTAYDEARTRSIERDGFHVIRVTNVDVTTNLQGVLTQISFSLREKEGTHAQHGKDEADHAKEKGAAA